MGNSLGPSVTHFKVTDHFLYLSESTHLELDNL